MSGDRTCEDCGEPVRDHQPHYDLGSGRWAHGMAIVCERALEYARPVRALTAERDRLTAELTALRAQLAAALDPDLTAEERGAAGEAVRAIRAGEHDELDAVAEGSAAALAVLRRRAALRGAR